MDTIWGTNLKIKDGDIFINMIKCTCHGNLRMGEKAVFTGSMYSITQINDQEYRVKSKEDDKDYRLKIIE
jgi:hypothetical protein